MLVLLALLLRGQMNLLCAVLALGTLLLISVFNKTTAILASLTYLILLGDLRRIVTVYLGQTKVDLLLLVAPIMAFYLALPSLLNLRLRDLLSKAFFVVFVLMILEVFNPQQGSFLIGFSGVFYYIAPVLWFWVGRQYASPIVLERFIYKIVLPLAIMAAVLGMAQTFVGFLPWEAIWIRDYARIASLHIGGVTRSFGFSVSAEEYAELLALGCAIIIAAAFARMRSWLLILPLLLTMLFLASSRSLILKLLFSAAVAFILRNPKKINSTSIFSLVIVLCLGLGGLYLGASHLAGGEDQQQQATGVGALVSHQTSGFAHPLNSRYSTASVHGSIILGALVSGFTDPVGHGLGSTGGAGGKFEGSGGIGSSEFDFTDMFITLGAVGGIAYLCVLYAAVRQGIYFLRVTPLRISLPVLGCLTVTIASWLRAGDYSTNAIACFCLGSIAHSSLSRR